MTDGEKVIAAYICQNEKLPDKRCEKCPYGYEYLDQTGDNYFVYCNTARIMVDAIDLLKAQEPRPKEVIYDDVHKSVYCPSCNNRLAGLTYSGAVALETEETPNYCWMCGQAVKW